MGKVYASADWHGCLGPARKILNYLQPDDKLYFLGDAIDRGNHGFQIMTHLLDDPRVIYMKGNHEEMMLEAIDHMLKYGDEYDTYMDDNWLYGNGGIKTYEDMDYGEGVNLGLLYSKLKKMPSLSIYTSKNNKIIYLEHAGYTPNIYGEPINTYHDRLWDRDHFYDNWVGGDNEYLIHGHTPVQYLKFYYGYNGEKPLTKEEMVIKNTWDNPGVYTPEVIRYCNGHKFDIDMCTIVSGRVALLDLDTFEIKYFDSEE